MKILKFTIFCFGIALFCLANTAAVYASTLYFDPQSNEIGTEKPFVIALNITAQEAVNALLVAIRIPPGLTPFDISDGNSIINFWLERPAYDPATRILSFSGIVPGGFIGNGGRLLLMKFNVDKNATSSLFDFDRTASRIILNGPAGEESIVNFEPLILEVKPGRENQSAELPDNTPPENFKPEIFRSKNLNSGLWTAVFTAQDKDSGINHYEIQEVLSKIPWSDDWQTATSPYILKDQELHSYIFIKAVDNKGNERIVTVMPPQGLLPPMWLIMSSILALGFMLVVLVYGLIVFLKSVIIR